MTAASGSDTTYLCVMELDSDKSFEGFESDKIEHGEARVRSSMTQNRQTVYDRDSDNDFKSDSKSTMSTATTLTTAVRTKTMT